MAQMCWKSFCKRADELSSEIRREIYKVDPFTLLGFAAKIASYEFVILEGQTSVFVRDEELGALRLCEYLQTALISGERNESVDAATTEKDDVLHKILVKVIDLYRLMQSALFYADMIYAELPYQVDDCVKRALNKNLLMFAVRGKRDASFQKKYHSILIPVHNDILKQLYGVSGNELIDGLERLQKRLRLAWYDYHERIGTLSPDKYYDYRILASSDEISDMFDVYKITQWPQKLLDDLSFEIGGQGTFYTGKMQGWPIKDLCIKDRPFIKIANRYFSFCYYILCDYFYRALEQAVKRRCKHEGILYEWDKNQCVASESEVARIFRSLFPNAKVFENNTYTITGKRNEPKENDLLVMIYDVVIIVEVKGGRRWHDSPAEKGHALSKNYVDVKEGIAQCRKMEKFLREAKNAEIFDSKWTSKCILPNISNNFFVFKIVVTVDSANEVASTTESLSGFAGDCKGVICISLDDLQVYEWWFENRPVLFLCFLRERLAATHIEEFSTCDELIHLSSFIACPYYAKLACHMLGHGFTGVDMGDLRTITNVLDARNNLGDNVERKYPSMPAFYSVIFSILDKTQNNHSLRIASLLLSMDAQKRIKFGAGLQKIIGEFLGKHRPLAAGLRINNDELLAVVVSYNFPMTIDCINIATEYTRGVVSRGEVKNAHLLIVYVSLVSGKCEGLELTMNFVRA